MFGTPTRGSRDVLHAFSASSAIVRKSGKQILGLLPSTYARGRHYEAVMVPALAVLLLTLMMSMPVLGLGVDAGATPGEGA